MKQSSIGTRQSSYPLQVRPFQCIIRSVKSNSGVRCAGRHWPAWRPRATPPALVDALHADVREVFGGRAVREELARQGMEPVAGTPEALAARIREESAGWAELIRSRGIKAE